MFCIGFHWTVHIFREEKTYKLAPNMLELVGGRNKERTVHICVKRYAMNCMPTDDEMLKQWLKERFELKNKYVIFLC